MIAAKFLLLLLPAAIASYRYYRNPRTIAFIMLVFVAGGVWLEIQPVDDMFISLRYAENWANGFGPVFNIGERVEGYTCFLWVAMLAALHRVGLNVLVAARVVSVFFALLSIYVLHRHSLRTESLRRTLSVCLFAFNLPLLYWSFVGMEASLMTFLNLSFLLLYLHWTETGDRSTLRFCALLALLATLTRPEGIIVYGISWIFLWRFSRTPGRDLLEFTLIYSAGLAIFLFWRYQYYGFLLPNTYYAKVDRFGLPLFFKGLKYTLLFYVPHCLLLLPLLFVAGAGLRRNQFVYLSVLLMAQTLAVIFEGGDHYPASRFFVPVLPVAALTWQYSEFQLGKLTLLPKIAPEVVVALLCAATLAAGFVIRGYRAFESAAGGERGQFISQWLTQNVPPDTLIATMSVGAVPYFTKLPTLDLVGLVDPHISHAPMQTGYGKIGHEKYDNDYVMRRKPGVFLFARCYQNEQELLDQGKDILPVYRDLLTRYFPHPDYQFVRVRNNRFCSSLLVRKDIVRK